MDRAREARHDIRLSIATAESGRHPDLVHYARVAHAMWASVDGASIEEATEGLHHVRSATRFAGRVGIPKLEAEALRVQGAIMLRQGELDEARRAAMRCLGITAAHGMGLRLTAALVFLGRVERMAKHLDRSGRILGAAIALARRQGYQAQLEEAERQRIA